MASKKTTDRLATQRVTLDMTSRLRGLHSSQKVNRPNTIANTDIRMTVSAVIG
jgi:hypothetical protein